MMDVYVCMIWYGTWSVDHLEKWEDVAIEWMRKDVKLREVKKFWLEVDTRGSTFTKED